MKEPVVVVDRGGHDLSIHASASEAERQLEASDVGNGEYVAYATEGRLLALSTTVEKRRVLLGAVGTNVEVVHIAEAETEPNHQEALRNALVAFLVALGSPRAALEDLSLHELLRQAQGSGGRRR